METNAFHYLHTLTAHVAASLMCVPHMPTYVHFLIPQPPTRSLGLDDSLQALPLADMVHRTVIRHASSIDHVLRAEGHVSRPLHLGGTLVFGGECFPLVPVVDVTVTANRVVLRTALRPILAAFDPLNSLHSQMADTDCLMKPLLLLWDAYDGLTVRRHPGR